MLVRASRDGDQFQYLWAARRCFRLLSPSTGLVAVTIEGASSIKFPAGEAVAAGEELIDVGEYYGSQDVTQATLVRYIQLKHSTLHANDIRQVRSTLRGNPEPSGGYNPRRKTGVLVRFEPARCHRCSEGYRGCRR